MKKIERGELLGLAEYEQVRPRFRDRVIQLKKRRRLSLGDHMSLVFENHDTLLLQVQEMLRTERISDERAIAHELETYNELIPSAGSVSATLFIEYEDVEERREMLKRFASLRDQVFLNVAATRAKASFATHFGEEMDRLPAVNYLAFPVGSEAATALRDLEQPAMLEIAHPDYEVVVDLPGPLRAELAADLSE